ncbi:hypothetical protein AAMO2058_001741700, partial [Amorphochlora amoebiformis]
MSMATRLGGMDAAFAEGGGDHWEDLAGHVSLLGSSSPHSGSADSHAEHHEDESSGLVIMFLAFSLIAGTAMHTISDKFSLPVPYTVLMLILGMVLGSVNLHGQAQNWFEEGMQMYAALDPHLLLQIFLPALIFESAFSASYHIIKRELGQALLLAG